MRRSFTVLAIAAMVLAIMCGAAWADANAVAAKIRGISGISAAVSGGTVTVTGTAAIEKNGDRVMYELGDLSGVTIDWKAELTVSLGNKINDNGNFIFNGTNGTFNMLSGKIELVSTPDRKTREVWVFGGHDTTYVLSGGTVSADSEGDRGFYGASSFSLDGATVYFPKGGAIADTPRLVKNEISKVTGIVNTYAEPDDLKNIGFETFGDITVSIRDRSGLQEAMHGSIVINKGADVKFSLGDYSGAKATFSCEVEGRCDFTDTIGSLTSLTVNAGGEAIIAKGSKVTVLGGTIYNVALSGAGDSARAAGDPGKLDVQGELTIPAGSKLKIEDIKSLTKGDGAKIDVKGKIELPSGTSAEAMKKLASDLGITGGVFEMNGKTYNDQGEETTSGSGSGGGCSAGSSLAAIAALAMIKRRKR